MAYPFVVVLKIYSHHCLNAVFRALGSKCFQTYFDLLNDTSPFASMADFHVTSVIFPCAVYRDYSFTPRLEYASVFVIR